MKKVLVVLVVAAVLVVGLVLAKNMILKIVIERGLKAAAGLPVTVEKTAIGLKDFSVGLWNVRIGNPAGFSEPLMAEIPELFVNLDLGALFGGKVHLKELRINVKELVLAQDAEMKFNFNSLALLLPPASGKKPMPVTIDSLRVIIGTVRYRNALLGGMVPPVALALNLDEQWKDVTEPKTVLQQLMQRIFDRLGVPNLLKGNAEALKGYFEEVAQETATKMLGAVEGAKDQAAGAVQQKKEEVQSQAQEALSQAVTAFTETIGTVEKSVVAPAEATKEPAASGN